MTRNFSFSHSVFKRLVLKTSKILRLFGNGLTCLVIDIIWVSLMFGLERYGGYEQFLLFPQCFQKDLYCRHIKTMACLGKTYTAETLEALERLYHSTGLIFL